MTAEIVPYLFTRYNKFYDCGILKFYSIIHRIILDCFRIFPGLTKYSVKVRNDMPYKLKTHNLKLCLFGICTHLQVHFLINTLWVSFSLFLLFWNQLVMTSYFKPVVSIKHFFWYLVGNLLVWKNFLKSATCLSEMYVLVSLNW